MKLLLCSALIAFGLYGSASAEALSKTQVEAIVKETLLNNPQLIEDALERLQQQRSEDKANQLKSFIKSAQDEISGSSGVHSIIGNPKGDVTLVEFYDYNCGYCRKALSDLKSILKDDKNIKVVLKELPVLSKDSEQAARISLQLRNHPNFFAFHEKLLNFNGRITADVAIQTAKELNMGGDELRAGLDDPKLKAIIDKNYALANALGIQGTPSYVLGTDMIYGAVGAEKLKSMVANSRKCGKAAGCN